MVTLALLTLILVRVVTKHQAVLLLKYKPEQNLRYVLDEQLQVLAMHAEPKLAKNKAKRLVTALVLLLQNVAVDALVDINATMEAAFLRVALNQVKQIAHMVAALVPMVVGGLDYAVKNVWIVLDIKEQLLMSVIPFIIKGQTTVLMLMFFTHIMIA